MSNPNVFGMRQTVTLLPHRQYVGLRPTQDTDETGERVLRARVEEHFTRVRVGDGEQTVKRVDAYIHSPDYAITELDRIQLADGSTPTIVGVAPETDLRGRATVYHVKFGPSRRTEQ